VASLRCRVAGSKKYKNCVQEMLKGSTKQSLIRTLDGRIYSWNNLLKMPSVLKPLSTKLKAIKVNPGRGSRPVRRPGRSVKLICDSKGCRTE
jgi:hypothetical protein